MKVFTISLADGVLAEWSIDPHVNNPVAVEDGSQREPSISADGVGGAVIVWSDNREGQYPMYAQRMNMVGVPLWALNGVVISDYPSIQQYPLIVPSATSHGWEGTRHLAACSSIGSTRGDGTAERGR